MSQHPSEFPVLSSEFGERPTRRTFMTTTAAAAAAFAWSGGVRAYGSDVIRLGLIGAGGRGTGAVSDCLRGTEGQNAYGADPLSSA